MWDNTDKPLWEGCKEFVQGKDYQDHSGNDKIPKQGTGIFVKWRLKGHQVPKEQVEKEEEKAEEKGISALQPNGTKEGIPLLFPTSQRFSEVGDSNLILDGF